MTSVIGIDISLASTGLARITYASGQWVTETSSRPSKGKRADSLAQRHERIRGIAADIHAWSSGGVLAVVEGPSFGSKGGSPVDRYGLWWRVVGRLIDAEIPVVSCPPPTSTVTVRGPTACWASAVMIRSHPPQTATRAIPVRTNATLVETCRSRIITIPLSVSDPAMHRPR